MPGPGIADAQSVVAGVEGGDLQPHQFSQHRIDGALAGEGPTERGDRLEHRGALRVRAGARRGPGLALGLLAEVPDLVVDLANSERLDSRHRVLLVARRAWLPRADGERIKNSPPSKSSAHVGPDPPGRDDGGQILAVHPCDEAEVDALGAVGLAFAMERAGGESLPAGGGPQGARAPPAP